MTAARSARRAANPMMLSVADVAAELRCGRDTVYALLSSGRLPSVLVGERLRRIRRPDLERYVAGLPARLPSNGRSPSNSKSTSSRPVASAATEV